MRLPDRAIGNDPAHLRRVAELVRLVRPRVVALPYWSDRHPGHAAASHLVAEAVFSAGLRRYPDEGEACKSDVTCYYFINDSAAPSFVVDVSDLYETKRRACVPRQPVSARRRRRGRDATDYSLFQQLIKTPDAQFGAQAGFAFAEGCIVRHPVVHHHLMPDHPAIESGQ